MENNVLNGLVLYRTKWFSDLVDETMLTNALMTKPYEVSTVLSYVFGAYEGSTSLDFLTQGLGQTLQVTSRQYEWPVMIEHDKAITIKDAQWQGAAITSNLTPGLNGTTVSIWVGEKWFGPGAVIAFDDREFQARVMGEPYQDGNDFVYTVVVANGKPESYIPPALLAAGKQISREGSAYEEYSEEADIVNYQTPFKLRNHLTTMRLTYDITADAYSSVMVIAMKDPKSGKTSYLWSDYQEWRALRQWYQTIEQFLVYSQYNANADGTVDLAGSNGRPIYIGAGLIEQIAPANKSYYTTLTVDLLEDFLFDLSYNVLGTSERKFVALTGEMGMKEFDRVLRAKASGYTLVDTKFVTGSGQNLTLEGQFTTYRMLNGIELTLRHFPILDNVIYNRKLHPITGKPLESYKFIFLDIGSRDGESNLVKVVRKDREQVMWYTGGSVAPGQGHAKSITTLRSNAKDGYSVFFLTEQGIMLKDPTSSGMLICDAE